MMMMMKCRECSVNKTGKTNKQYRQMKAVLFNMALFS